MKNVILLYNPKSGDTYFRFELDKFIQIFNSKGYDVRLFRSHGKGQIEKYILESNLDNTEAIFVAGGDGSVNEGVNGIMKRNTSIPLGVIPAGTANDFARYLKMPTDFDKCFEVLSEMKTQKVDVGLVNDHYFINICCGGLFTNVSQNIDIELKNTLGKMAYYLKGAEQVPNFKPMNLKITTPSEVYEDKFFLFLLLNGSGAGGFDKICPESSITDGYLDFIGVRALSVVDLPRLLMRIIKGVHLNDQSILYLKDNSFKIESDDVKEAFKECDVDGERGPQLPIEVSLLNNALNIITNRF